MKKMKPVQRWAIVQPGPRIVWVASEDGMDYIHIAKDTLKAFRTIPFKPKKCRMVRVEIREV